MTAKRFTVEEMQNWNKRYKLDKTGKCVIDTFDGGEYWTVHGNEAYNLCIDMNALYDENEQLKKELDKLKVVNEMLSMDFSNSEHELLKENEKLKKQLNSFKPIIFEDANNEGCSILYEKELEK